MIADVDNYINNESNTMAFNMLWRHIGLYAYRCGFLKSYLSYGNCPLDCEMRAVKDSLVW